MPSIKIPTPLRPFTGEKNEIAVSGATIGDALNDLVTQFPELKAHLFNGDQLRSFVNVYLGDEDIRFLNGLDTDLEATSQLRIIPSIAGG